MQQEVLPPWLGFNLLQDHWQVQLQVACTDTAQSIRGGCSDLLSGGTEGTNDHIQQGSVGAEVTVRSGGGRGVVVGITRSTVCPLYVHITLCSKEEVGSGGDSSSA